MPRIVTALVLGLASGFSSYERKEGCPELYWRGVLDLDFNPAFLHVDEYASGQALTITSFFNLDSVVPFPPPPTFAFFNTDLVARAMLDPHVRIAQTEMYKAAPAAQESARPDGREYRSWHTDWPHDLSAYLHSDLSGFSQEPWRNAGAVAQPFPDITMALSTIWYLGPEDVSPHNGATWIVPYSHKDPRNPRGPADGIDERSPIPGELQIRCPAGSTFIQDSRTWHTNGLNYSQTPRHAAVLRYAPWWLSVNEFGGGIPTSQCNTYVPRSAFERLPVAVQELYRHCVRGEQPYNIGRLGAEDYIQ